MKSLYKSSINGIFNGKSQPATNSLAPIYEKSGTVVKIED